MRFFPFGLFILLAFIACDMASVQPAEPQEQYKKFFVDSSDPLYLYSTVVMEQEVRVIRFDSRGIPMAYVSPDHIGVNEDFLTLPRYAQEAVIAHELGHLNLGHLDEEPGIDRDWYFMLWGTVDPRERDADLFAVDLIGEDSVLRMLEYSKAQCELVEATNCVIEAIIRHAIISGKVCL